MTSHNDDGTPNLEPEAPEVLQLTFNEEEDTILALFHCELLELAKLGPTKEQWLVALPKLLEEALEELKLIQSKCTPEEKESYLMALTQDCLREHGVIVEELGVALDSVDDSSEDTKRGKHIGVRLVTECKSAL